MKGMKPPAKRLVSSSPGRPENLPAVSLLRLLRGRGGSRSRGRSSSSSYSSHPRSSPMFVVTRRRSAPEIQEEKEPTSPKVTCIGQVRIKSKKPSSSSSSSTSSKPSSKQHQHEVSGFTRCHCLRRTLLCNPFSRKPKARAGAPVWRRWVVGCCCCSCSFSSRRYRLRGEEDPCTPARSAMAGKAGSDREEEEGGRDPEGDGDEEEEENRVFFPATPPKNALLLMRCRSAPHRAASLTATRFGGVATAPESNGEVERGIEESESDGFGAVEEKGEEGREGDDGEESAALGSEVGPSLSFSSQPLILTRCKSEPARKAAKLAPPEASYWNQRNRATDVAAATNNNNNESNSNSKIKNKNWFSLVDEPCPPPNFQ